MSYSVYMREHGYGSPLVYVGSGYSDGRCSTISSIGAKGLSEITGGSYKDLSKTYGYYEFHCSYLNQSDSKKTNSELNNRAIKESRCSENSVKQLSNSKGKFSVICTEKAKNTDFGGSSVGSLGGDSANSASSGGSSSNNSGSGQSAGGGAGGKGAGGGSSASSAGTASADGKNGGSGSSQGSGSGSNNSDGSNSGSGSGSGLSNGGSGNSNDSNASSSNSNGSNSGSGSGSGDGGSEGFGDFPQAPDGGGEPDWGGIKSDGGFGTFSPSSAFSTGGYCPQDIQLDFGQFGRHSLTLSFVCEAAEKLRYVFITLAYFTAAMMIFKTVNSIKG